MDNKTNTMEIEYEKFVNPRKILGFVPINYVEKINFVSMLFGRQVGNIANFGQKPKLYSRDLRKHRFVKKMFKMYDETVETFDDELKMSNTLVSSGKITLDTIEITHKGKPREKYMLVVPGRGALYEGMIRQLIKFAKTFDVNVVCFNHRGINKSKGYASNYKGNVEDGIIEVNRLIKRGIAPCNIILYGECMGAATATLVCDHFHRSGRKIYLFNDRSYSKPSRIVAAAPKEILYNKGKYFWGMMVKLMISPIVNFILSITGWNVNVTPAYQRIDPKYKEYIVVRSSKEQRKRENMRDDGLVEYEASLHYALKPYRKREKVVIHKALDGYNKALRKLPSDEGLKGNVDKLSKDLEKYKKRKMEGDKNPENQSFTDLIKVKQIRRVGHYKELKELKSRDGETSGEEFLKKFIGEMGRKYDGASRIEDKSRE